MNSQELFIKECNILRENDDIKKVHQRENGFFNSCMFFFCPGSKWFQHISALSIYDSAHSSASMCLPSLAVHPWLNLGAPSDTISCCPNWPMARFSSYTLCITKTAINHISLKVCIVKNIEKNIAFMIWYINWSAILWANFYRITVVENGTMFPVACRYKGFIVETWLGDFFGPSTDFTNRSLGFINKSQNSLNRSRIGMAPSQKEAKAVCKVYPVYPIFKPPDADVFLRS